MARGSDSITKQIRAVRKALRGVNRAVARLSAALNGQPPAAARKGTPKLSPKRHAQLKLHGAYIGHLRHLKPRQKAQVQAVKAKKGYEAAIKMAKRLAGN